MQATCLPFETVTEAPFWDLIEAPYAIGSEAWQAAQVRSQCRGSLCSKHCRFINVMSSQAMHCRTCTHVRGHGLQDMAAHAGEFVVKGCFVRRAPDLGPFTLSFRSDNWRSRSGPCWTT